MSDPTRRPAGRDADAPATRSKVARLIDDYDLEGAGSELAARWRGETGERDSLRELADRFNRRLLRESLEAADIDYLDGEVENLYRLLTADAVSRGKRAEARGRLERDGIDVDRLAGDFVSHQSMHTYLTKHRGVSPPTASPGDGDRLEGAGDTIQRLRNRLGAVTERTLGELRAGDHLDVGEFDVLVEVNVLCRDCGRYSEVSELLEAERCTCAGGDPP